MEGYSVVTTDDKRVGHVVGVTGDYYIIERGSLKKARYVLPKRYGAVMSDGDYMRVQVSKETLCGGPKVGRDGRIDELAVAEYYGD